MSGPRVVSFASQLQQQLHAGRIKASGATGVALSPISLYIALGLALNGAGPGSSSQQELYHLLHQDKDRLLGLLAPQPAAAADVEQLTNELSVLSSGLAGQSGNGCELIIANAVFTNKLPIRQEYAAAMLQQLQAKVQETDSVDVINAWAAEATRGLIQQAVPPGTPFDLVLTNAVYFKGLWEFAFQKDATRKAAFTLEGGGQQVQVDMMHRTFKPMDKASGDASRRVLYRQEPGFSAVRLPYKGTSISAVAVLPSAGGGGGGSITAAVAALDLSEVLDAKAYLRAPMAGLELHMPRFKLQTDCVSLKDALMALGVRSAFEDRAADFSRLSSEPTHISDVLQSVCVIVDEEGTEAAAVTAVVMLRRLAAAGPPPCIRLDRPFLFLLVDDATSTPLFSAIVQDPSQ